VTSRKSIAAIVVAAGRGERAGAGGETVPKQYRALAGVPVLVRTINALLDHDGIDWVLPVIHPDHVERYDALGISDERVLAPVLGGAERQASVLEGLKGLGAKRPDLVLIQDAARPLVNRDIIQGVIDALSGAEAALPVVPVTDTIKRSTDGVTVTATEDRSTLFAAQTPQGFRFPQILSAHMRASRLPRPFTDDSAIAEWAGLRVALTTGSADNIKITSPTDFTRAERILDGTQTMNFHHVNVEMRVGMGVDFHQFVDGDAVWLGGVKIPHNKKLSGHSDADAALHALTDALYGAIGEGDIGTHFPPSDPQWKGAASSIFLEHAGKLVAARGGRVVNVDLTIVCEAPRIGPHVAAMKETIGAILGIGADRVAVKATTSEQMGFAGRGEGLMAQAVATVELPREV
jgi:2-C-methyl-D-erythritol 4-phosphate cytidylyltransferase / 2-C-methyl-D-erythritol 2,4-cyclodiphosphate synthase